MLMLRNLSIAAKLTAMNMLVSGTALVIACLAFIAYDVFSFRQSMVHNLSIQAQMAGSNSISPLLFNDTKAAENTLSALKAARSIVSAGIYTPDGSPFATYWRDGHDRNLQPPQIPAGQTEALHSFWTHSYATATMAQIIARIKAERFPGKKVHVVATGGYADLIGGRLREIDAVHPNLTLEGLRIVANLNA